MSLDCTCHLSPPCSSCVENSCECGKRTYGRDELDTPRCDDCARRALAVSGSAEIDRLRAENERLQNEAAKLRFEVARLTIPTKPVEPVKFTGPRLIWSAR